MQLSLIFNNGNVSPTYRELHGALKEAIESKIIPAGTNLPPVRELAERLSVSRSTVMRSYDLLKDDGLAISSPGSGVSVRVPFGHKEKQMHSDADKFNTSEEAKQNGLLEDDSVLNFAPETENLSIAKGKEVRRPSFSMHKPWTQSYEIDSLKTVLIEYFRRTRLISTVPDACLLFSDIHHAWDAIATILLEPGDVVALESPCDVSLRNLLTAHGAEIIDIPIDEEGACIEKLIEGDILPKIVFVTPCNQTPTAIPLSQRRRNQLLEWSYYKSVLVVEDDSEGIWQFFRTRQMPLKASSPVDTVLTISKIGMPGESLDIPAAMFLPQNLHSHFEDLSRQSRISISQRVVSHLVDSLSSGGLERELHKTRTKFQKLRQQAYFHLSVGLNGLIELSKTSCGIRIPFSISTVNDVVIQRAAADAQLPIEKLQYSTSGKKQYEYILRLDRLDSTHLAKQIKIFAATIKRNIELEQSEKTSTESVTATDQSHVGSVETNDAPIPQVTTVQTSFSPPPNLTGLFS